MDYTQYSVEDLASNEGFIEWATQRDTESQRFWDDFLQRHPEMKVKILQARTLVLNLAKAQGRHHPEEQIVEIWQAIDDSIERMSRDQAPKRGRSLMLRYGVAAVLTVTIVAFISYRHLRSDELAASHFEGKTIPASDYIEEVNTSGNALRLYLSDGSVVVLQNNSRLRYKRDYKGDSARNVYLSGEAFFEVARDPSQPFLVHANEVVTRVLGTSFWVKAPDGKEEIIVSVRTGKVSVYTVGKGETGTKSHKNAVVLLPNEQVIYQRDFETFGKELVSEPEIVLPFIKEEDFNFENKPVREVFDILEEAYGVDIIFDAEVMSNCFFTAPLGSAHLFEKLRIICRAIGARYEIIDAKVVVTSSGC